MTGILPETVECGGCGRETARAVVDDPELGQAGPYELVCDECPWTMYVPAETTARSRIEAVRRIATGHKAERIDGYLVDAVTASMLLAVYEAISPAARERFGKPSLPRLVELGWKHTKAVS